MRNYAISFDINGNTIEDAPRLINDRGFRVDIVTEATLAYLDRPKDKPFFLYVSYFAPHTPLEAPQHYQDRFPFIEDPKRLLGLSMIAAIDDGVVKIRKRLREMGIEENTLVFFISDNGAPLRPGMEDGSLNVPLVGEKGMLTDGGVRIPFMVEWPGTLPKGKVYTDPVIALDILPTAVHAAGSKTMPEWELDGVNLLPYLLEEKTEPPHQDLFWRFNGQAAMLRDRWKLVYLATGKWLLFDLYSAEGETQDVSDQYPEVFSGLQQRLLQWCYEQVPPGLPKRFTDLESEMYRDHLGLELGVN
jgi:arylsulfatase A-like enzyme